MSYRSLSSPSSSPPLSLCPYSYLSPTPLVNFYNIFLEMLLDGSLLLSVMVWYPGRIKISHSFNTRTLTEMSSLTNWVQPEDLG